ncbi:MAG TPA: hypothetical protein VG147_12835 [Solirubrobacteraceae bacterium]|jgi:hypothetical protein|nr:hypothetical protein [Solirubrobacteraceae bacterium]
MALGALLRRGVCFPLPTAPAAMLFVAARVSLRPSFPTSPSTAPTTFLAPGRSVATPRATGLIAAAAPPFVTPAFLLRLRPLPLRLMSASLPATPSTGFGFAGLRALLTAPRSVLVSGPLPATAPALLFATSGALLADF